MNNKGNYQATYLMEHQNIATIYSDDRDFDRFGQLMCTEPEKCR